MQLTQKQIEFRLQVAYALRNYAENWEIRDIAREYINNKMSCPKCRMIMSLLADGQHECDNCGYEQK